MQELEAPQKENYQRESRVYRVYLDFSDFGASFSHLLNLAVKDADNSHSPLKQTCDELELNCAPLCRCCGPI